VTPQETIEWKIKELDRQFYVCELESTDRRLRLVQDKIARLKQLQTILKEPDSMTESK
jgi:hypothetical protein